MDDRELLERAARAAGIEILGPVEKFVVQFEDRHKGGFIIRNDRGGDSCWNPLEDDGDAMRLAVKLRLNIEWTHRLGSGWRQECVQVSPKAQGHLAEFGYLAGDENALLRQFIVRAAAALGGE